ncbi:pseudouridine synthase [Thalassobaculum fulvum]|uniref:Pseudouridine synthase n=1 Tax=Thalassobaculum fulvum TaxID=1633335 RepID=A0A919CRQ4_9PROT|nr:RluA family pseudouridine synthase [Thalassobaculum fulvum]GHD58935.1 pseudouridine synthase [Thalassobaculum fulvum]
MKTVETRVVEPDDADQRLDRWFKRHFPGVGHGHLAKLLRTGQVRVDGKRAKANQRLEAGQSVRIPPMDEAPAPEVRPARAAPKVDDELVERLKRAVLYRDRDVLAINKPAGLATQGGSGITSHVDGALDGLKFDARERPRLVHRLDKDTSGVLLLGRSQQAARRLAEAFRAKSAMKIYWALVVGEPRPSAGTIEGAIAKLPGRAGEKMAIDPETGKRAVTRYAIVERLGGKVTWVALFPVTGRTHQLRVHMAELGTPILGDGKYGGADAFLQGEGVSRKLHLHARAIRIPGMDGNSGGGRPLEITAPLDDHMKRSWKFFGLDEAAGRDPFEPFEE